MRIKVFLFFLFGLLILNHSKAQFVDDFSDGNFSNNPSWFGDTAKFEINVSKKLHLNDASASSTAYLTTASQAIINASWEFYIQLDFAPSASNYAKVYVVSNNSKLTANLNGYFIQIGGVSGTVDDVSLYRQDGNSSQKIIDGIDGRVAINPELKIKLSRDSIGNWQLFSDTTINGNNYVLEGIVNDTIYQQSSYFGVECIYTSTRSDKFYFDDFSVSGQVLQDKIKPKINSLNVLSDTELEILFSENVDTTSAQNVSNYLVDNGIGNPMTASIYSTDSSKVKLTFTNSFTNGTTYQIKVENIEDRNANKIDSVQKSFIYIVTATASIRDVVINEIFADPTPSVGLPEKEYIEIFNASNQYFDLENWKLSDGASVALFPSRILAPNEYLTICLLSDLSDFQSFPNVLGLANFPTLTNSGENLLLADNISQIIDEVNYTDKWYQDNIKKAGGYSLEQINPLAKCSGINNWKASKATIGGTPSGQNSVFSNVQDTTPPQLLSIIVENKDSIVLVFDEKLDSNSVISATYLFDSGNSVHTVQNIPSDYLRVRLVLAQSLISGTINSMTISGIKDCSGNEINQTIVRTFALPQSADSNDLIINEILFNPKSGGVDFVEIYNNSNKIISLKDWKLANKDKDTIDNFKTIVEENFLLLPQSYIVLTTNKENIQREYPMSFSDRFLEMSSFPSFNDDEGSVYLIMPDQKISDYFDYNEDMHLSLLKDLNGVSLERISFDRPANEKGSWHSAAATVGFATPTYKNSQYLAFENSLKEITIVPEVFSPDNDGFEDLISFNYYFEQAGYIVSFEIYDAKGRLIKNLANNKSVETSGNFIWDGISNDNNKAPIGAYILIVKAFNLEGNTEIIKRPFVLAGKF